MKKLLGLITTLLFHVGYISAWADPPTRQIQLPFSLKGKRQQIEIQLADVQKIVFFTTTSGNSSNALTVLAEGPAGMKVGVEMATFTGALTTALLRNSRFWPIPLRQRKAALKEEASSCITYRPNTEPEGRPEIRRHASNSPLCDLFSPQELVDIGGELGRVYGGTWTRSEICGYIVDSYFGGAEQCDPADPICSVPGQATPATVKIASARQTSPETAGTERIEAFGLLEKNACAPAKTKYVVKITIDLSALNAESVPHAVVSLQASEYRYTGPKAAELKPKSDGKFAPQPIILMSFLGTFCGQKLNVVRWAQGKPRATMPVRIDDLIMLKQRMFIRAPITRVLTGGSGTFELFTSTRGYGVCFELAKRRQKINGF